MKKEIPLLFLLFYMTSGNAASLDLPGKPMLTNCRSPEKETFTCWWKPGSDGGLPTTYALFYHKDNSDTLYECPDYHTAGKNSCFFNKNETSVWVNYNITVVATNEMGRTFSDPVDVDVAYIVQPHTPENVTVTVMEDKGWPFLRVSWESPHKADVRSGWITLVYELRSKMEGEEEWEEHFPGQQKTFNIFSIRSGHSYVVQVRCKPDHGFWSEWTSTAEIKVPEYVLRERPLVIFFGAFFLIFVIFAWILYLNSRSLKAWILPPIPGPKIKGFDHQRLKDGSYKGGLNALMIPEFPANSSSDYEDLLVEYLEVSVSGEQESSIEGAKDMPDQYCKFESSRCDSDSGRGSCDSHTLLTDKHKLNSKTIQKPETSHHIQNESIYQDGAVNGRVNTWPCLLQCTSSPIPHKNDLEMAKQHCLSDTVLPLGSLGSSNSQIESFRSTHSDIDLCKRTNESFTPAQYVEVQTMNEENMIILRPMESMERRAQACPHARHREDYSQVQGLRNGNVLLVKNEENEGGEAMHGCLCDQMETNCSKNSEYMPANALKHQDASEITLTQPVQEQQPLGVNGYVDTAMAFSVSM